LRQTFDDLLVSIIVFGSWYKNPYFMIKHYGE